jgi:hypothetical protein
MLDPDQLNTYPATAALNSDVKMSPKIKKKVKKTVT